MTRGTSAEPRRPEDAGHAHDSEPGWEDVLTSAPDVDLTQIDRLLELSPTERLHALVSAANNLIRFKQSARRV